MDKNMKLGLLKWGSVVDSRRSREFKDCEACITSGFSTTVLQGQQGQFEA